MRWAPLPVGGGPSPAEGTGQLLKGRVPVLWERQGNQPGDRRPTPPMQRRLWPGNSTGVVGSLLRRHAPGKPLGATADLV